MPSSADEERDADRRAHWSRSGVRVGAALGARDPGHLFAAILESSYAARVLSMVS